MENWTLDDWLNDLDNCVKRGLYFEISGHSAGLLRDQIKKAADIIEKLREESQQQSDAVSRAYANGYDAAYAMGYSEGLKETLYDGMPRRDDRGDNLDGN